MQEELLSQYIDSLKGKMDRIDSLLSKFIEGNSKAGDNIRLLAHTLHGSGTTFGFPEISEAGKNAELANKDELEQKLLALKKVLQDTVANNQKNSSGSGNAEPDSQQSDSSSANNEQAAKSARADKSANAKNEEGRVLKILVEEEDAKIAGVNPSRP